MLGKLRSRRLFVRPVEKQELPKTTKAGDLAALLVNNWEGAQVRAKAEQSDKPLELFFNNAFNVLLRN